MAHPTQEMTRGEANAKKDNASGYSAIAYAGLSIGGAALLAAAIVFIVDPTRGETHERQSYVVAPVVDGKGGGLVALLHTAAGDLQGGERPDSAGLPHQPGLDLVLMLLEEPRGATQ